MIEKLSVREALQQLAWNLNYDGFCELLGLRHDGYAEAKWDEFRLLIQNMTRLGDYFDKLVEAGAGEAKP